MADLMARSPVASMSRSGAMKQDAAFARRQDDALTMLPHKDRQTLVPYHRPEADVNKFSEEVQGSFSRFPQLCAKVDSDGPDKCLRCLWRLKRLDMMRVLRKRNRDEEGGCGSSAHQEMDLLEFHDDGAKCSRMVVEAMPAVYDMPKVRGLFDLAGEPPRRERAHKDKTVMRLAGAPCPLDRVRFLNEVSCVFVDFQARHLTEKLLELVNKAVESSGEHHAKARCSTQQFESAVCNAGMLNKVTKRKMGRAFHRLVALDRHEHDNRRKHRMLPKLLRRGSTRTSLGSIDITTGLKKVTFSTNPSEMRQNFTYQLDEDPENEQEHTLMNSFHFLTWLRASEHAAVQIDCEISAGEDVEWTLVLYDLLDTMWPWASQDEGAPEVGVDDELNMIFRGLFLGITSRPVIIGPEYVTTSLSGIRLHNPAVLHRGHKLPAANREIVKSSRHYPAVVVLRLDRRRLAEEKKGFACRLWMQRLSGCTENDVAAQVLIDDLGVDNDIDLFPCVYASRPESDIRHAVKLRACDTSCSAGVKAGDRTVGKECSYLHEELQAVSPTLRRRLLGIQHGSMWATDLSPEHQKVALAIAPGSPKIEKHGSTWATDLSPEHQKDALAHAPSSPKKDIASAAGYA